MGASDWRAAVCVRADICRKLRDRQEDWQEDIRIHASLYAYLKYENVGVANCRCPGGNAPPLCQRQLVYDCLVR
jgi:hypothetical protein